MKIGAQEREALRQSVEAYVYRHPLLDEKRKAKTSLRGVCLCCGQQVVDRGYDPTLHVQGCDAAKAEQEASEAEERFLEVAPALIAGLIAEVEKLRSMGAK
jgi:hypothetical protein